MENWQNWIDQKIREVIGDGDMSGLPGAGKPLNLDDDSHVPAELRNAYKIMRDHEVMPGWVMLGQELLRDRDTLNTRLQRFAQDYRQRVSEAQRMGSSVLEREAEKRWQSACERLSEQACNYNKKVLDYNISIPPQISQREPFDVVAAIARALRS